MQIVVASDKRLCNCLGMEIQQCLAGFKTTTVIGGPFTVRVHEALDAESRHTASRYFISVDFKFKQIDAMNIGAMGYYGSTKTEATREANKLAASLTEAAQTSKRADESALNFDTFTNRFTAKMQKERLDKMVGKYNSEFIQ